MYSGQVTEYTEPVDQWFCGKVWNSHFILNANKPKETIVDSWIFGGSAISQTLFLSDSLRGCSARLQSGLEVQD